MRRMPLGHERQPIATLVALKPCKLRVMLVQRLQPVQNIAHKCAPVLLLLAFALRQQDLAELRGENLKPSKLTAKRQGADRVYGYQVRTGN